MIEWIRNLEPWQNILVSFFLLVVMVFCLTVAAVVLFARIDKDNGEPPISEEELKHKRERAAFLAATKPHPKLRGMK